MSSIIEVLSKEYIELHEKMQAVANSIKVYGGKLPSIPGHKYSDAVLEATVDDIAAYPSEGTWKDKILFALKETGKPSTVGTLSEIIHKYQTKTDLQTIVNALTQTCSSMASSGKIIAEKGYRNKYSLKKE